MFALAYEELSFNAVILGELYFISFHFAPSTDLSFLHMNSVCTVYATLVTSSFTMVLETAVKFVEVYLCPLKEGKVSNNQPPFALQ